MIMPFLKAVDQPPYCCAEGPTPMADASLDTVHLRHCVERWQQGDRAAADELLLVAGHRLERLARKMLKGFPNVRAWAETGDVLQSSLVRLLRNLRARCPSSTRDFYSLAALHVRRELLDLARYFRGRRCVSLDLPGNAAESHAGGLPVVEKRIPSPDELELWCRFHEAVEELPAHEHEVVGLVFYHGWTQAQIAELLGVDVRTVRRRWQAACLELHAALGGELPCGGAG